MLLYDCLGNRSLKSSKSNTFFFIHAEKFTYDLHDKRLCGAEVPIMNYVEHIGEFNEIAEIRDDYEPNFNFERDYSKIGTIPGEDNKQLFDEMEKYRYGERAEQIKGGL